MANEVSYFEIIGKDPEKLQKFYGGLFDWKINVIPDIDGYGMIETEGVEGSIGAIGGTMTPGEPTGNRLYVGVPDPQAVLDKVVELGGKVIMPVTEIPDMVVFALYADPEGNINGIYKKD